MVFSIPHWLRIGSLVGTPPRPWRVPAAFGATDAELIQLAHADAPQDLRVHWDQLALLCVPRLP